MPQPTARILYKFLLVVLATGFSLVANAQLTERYSTINILPMQNLFYAVDSMHHPDTVPPRFQQYHPLFRNEVAFLSQGNIVSASQSLIFNAERESGLDMGLLQPYSYFLFSPQNINMYKVRRAYTDLVYTQGAGELIGIKALHTQNILPNWNIGIDYNRIKSDGFQLRQRTSVYNTRFFNWYHSPDERYHLIITATWNRLRNEENGGLKSDSAFENSTALSQFPVRLGDDIDKVRNYIKTNDYRITNMLRLGPKKQVKYYQPEAMTYELDTQQTLIPTYVVAHQFAYNTNRYLFRDDSYDTNTYYPYTFLNDERTFDSIQHNVISNSITISNGPFMGYLRDTLPVKRWLMLSATGGYDYHFIAWQTTTNARYNNTYVGGSILSNPYIAAAVKFNAEGRFWLTGYNQADYKLKGRLDIDFGAFVLEGRALFQAYRPQITQYFFVGNHAYWKNDFDKTFVNTLSATLRTKRLKNNYHLTFKQQLVNNYIYFDSTLTARQEAKAVSITSINFKKRFQAGKFFLDNNITAQFTNNEDILRLPALSTWNSLYFQGYMFKKAMYAQIGVDFFYYSQVTANTFDPETKQFYIQNKVDIGNYPWFDVFINGHVRNFTLSAKMEHVTAGFFGRRYYAMPHQPMHGRVFRLGISWKFFD